MDRKSIIIIVACVLMLAVWQFVIEPKYFPYTPAPTSGTNATEQAQSPGATTNAMGAPATVSSNRLLPQFEVNDDQRQRALHLLVLWRRIEAD
jgi:hypothetical protein